MKYIHIILIFLYLLSLRLPLFSIVAPVSRLLYTGYPLPSNVVLSLKDLGNFLEHLVTLCIYGDIGLSGPQVPCTINQETALYNSGFKSLSGISADIKSSIAVVDMFLCWSR